MFIYEDMHVTCTLFQLYYHILCVVATVGIIWNFKCYNFNFNNYVGLRIEVNETATTRTQFCVGEMLTLVCRHDTSIHAWEVPPSITGIDF